jgi:hypothetical protein
MHSTRTDASAKQAEAFEFVLTDTTQGIEIPHWQIDSQSLGLKTAKPFTIRKTTLHGGRQEGSTLIAIDTGDLCLTVIPTRGMGLLSARAGEVALGWQSPVEEVVHPSFVNLEGRGGLGWLDGFNEMLARCGFEWSGHPDIEDGRRLTLHGRVQNIPASRVVVSIQATAPHRISIRGLVKEKTFKFSNLETWAGVSVVPGECAFRVHDELRNLSAYERDYQIIYHSNFGAPLLEGGAQFKAAAEEVAPFNEYAQAGLAGWQSYLPPTPGFDEMVFTLKPYADANGETMAMLSNRAGTSGVALGFNVGQLPQLTLWKNTDAESEAYVTGIEPGSCFPYPRHVERAQGRVRKIAPNEVKAFDVEYRILGSSAEVQAAAARIEAIQAGRPTTLLDTPRYQPPAG